LNREQQALSDFVQRAHRGLYLHPALWLLLTVFDGMARTAPTLFWIYTAGFAVLTALRLIFLRKSAPLLQRHPVRARRLIRLQVFAPCMQWSLLAVISTSAGPLHVLMLPMILVMVGLATAGTVVLSIDNFVRIWFPIVALVPLGAAVFLTQPAPMGQLLPIMIFITLAYVYVSTRVVNQDYFTALEVRSVLEERASILESLSTTDPLTQIPNRLYFERCLEQAWSDAARERRPISVMLVDLDHFKGINDTHGHLIGDECLKAAAKTMIRGMLRAGDSVARWGGEEFAVLLPEADAEAAQLVAQRILKAVSATLVPYPGGMVRLGCSIGVATLKPEAADVRGARSLVSEADKALYAAKSQGRNRVVAAAA
jgi:diguanylate cyclase (GGDEF)-like protein